MEPKEAKSSPEKMTDLERSLLNALRRLYVWVNDGNPGSTRQEVLSNAQRQIAAGEAKELQ